ncbi:I protein [Roseibium sp. TrichSKD4]|uniref:I protein n=1 Tax=Roseibium sp. TrichSKD4 TaxID=744980 RepID=UPI0001E56CAD|nr:I protein [Roseibium sp. TrichSKD4]EFO33229.1 I protein [Roseibium sp. TrichSKD4]
MSKSSNQGHLAIALNASNGAPNQIQLLPKGEVNGLDGRRWINSQPEKVVAEFEARNSQPLVIDYEHANHLRKGEPMPAAGWITGLEVRGGEVWGTVEWTKKAINMIAEREYRYLSPVFRHDTSGVIHKIADAGLTNKPNLMMKALNREEISEPECTMDKEMRIALCRQLGLADEASDTAILEAVKAKDGELQTALNKADQPDPQKFVPKADYELVSGKLSTALNKVAELEGAEAEQVVDQAIKDGKITPSSKDYHLAACKTEDGLNSFRKMVEGAPTLIETKPGDKSGDPGGDKIALNKDQSKILASLGIDPANEDVLKDLKASA